MTSGAVVRTSFAIVPKWVLDRVSNPTALRYYLHLACRYANERREAYPLEQTMADELGDSLATAQRAIRALRQADALVITRTRKDDGHMGRNLYWLPMDDPRHTSHLMAGADQGKQGVSGGGDHTSNMTDGHTSNMTDREPYPSKPQPDKRSEPANAGSADASSGGLADDDQPPLLAGLEPPANGHRGRARKPRAASNAGAAGGDGSGVTAQTVTAAWVDAYREAHQGVQPTKSVIKRVGACAKELIDAGNDPQRVVTAAQAAGRVGFATLDRELNRMATTGQHTNGQPTNGYRKHFNHLTDDDYAIPEGYRGSIHR